MGKGNQKKKKREKSKIQTEISDKFICISHTHTHTHKLKRKHYCISECEIIYSFYYSCTWVHVNGNVRRQSSNAYEGKCHTQNMMGMLLSLSFLCASTIACFDKQGHQENPYSCEQMQELNILINQLTLLHHNISESLCLLLFMNGQTAAQQPSDQTNTYEWNNSNQC